MTGLRRKKHREAADAPPKDLEKLTDEEITEQVLRFSNDEEALTCLEQELNRRDEAAAAARKAAGPAAQDDPIATLAEYDDMGDLTDDHLSALMERYRDDPDGMARVLDELDRIEQQTRQREQWSWNWREEETDADRQISDLIASGRYSYMERTPRCTGWTRRSWTVRSGGRCWSRNAVRVRTSTRRCAGCTPGGLTRCTTRLRPRRTASC